MSCGGEFVQVGKGEHLREIGGVFRFRLGFFIEHMGFCVSCGAVSWSLEALRA